MQTIMDKTTANRLATGAGGTITLGGVDYVVSQPTDKDIAAIGAEAVKIAKRQRSAKLLTLYRELESLPIAQQFLAEADPPLDFTGEAAAKSLQTIMLTAEGAAYLAWTLIRREQPAVTLAELRAAISEDNAVAVALELLDAAGMLSVAPNSPGGTGSTPATTATPTAPASTAS